MASFRAQKAASLRDSGLTYKAIAEQFDISETVARHLVLTGQRAVEPDEIVFPGGLRPETPVERLPLCRSVRMALLECDIERFGDLLEANVREIIRTVLRYPNVGRKKVEAIAALLADWSEQNRRSERQS